MSIYAKHNDTWVLVGSASGGELPGLGGWATIKEVSGTYTKHIDGDWVAYEWTQDGSVTLDESGLVDVLVVDAGTGISTRTDLGGHGGGVFRGVEYEESGAPVEIQVGVSSIGHNPVGRYWSVFGSINGVGQVTGGSSGGDTSQHPIHGRGLGDRSAGLGQMHEITGNNLGYGGGGGGNFTGQSGYPIPEYDPVYGGGLTPRPNSGGGYGNGYESPRPPTNKAGADGVVIVRVPKANADNVTENFFRWISYATVENGVVTKVTKTPDNKPYTVSTNEVECDASVQEGYLYENGEFTVPEPNYSEEIEALTARLEELRNG